MLRTPLLVANPAGMTINAKVDGELRVRVLDEAGKPVAGLDWSDCEPIRGDSVHHIVRWKGDAAALSGKPLRLEFSLNSGRLYGFNLTR